MTRPSFCWCGDLTERCNARKIQIMKRDSFEVGEWHLPDQPKALRAMKDAADALRSHLPKDDSGEKKTMPTLPPPAFPPMNKAFLREEIVRLTEHIQKELLRRLDSNDGFLMLHQERAMSGRVALSMVTRGILDLSIMSAAHQFDYPAEPCGEGRLKQLDEQYSNQFNIIHNIIAYQLAARHENTVRLRRIEAEKAASTPGSATVEHYVFEGSFDTKTGDLSSSRWTKIDPEKLKEEVAAIKADPRSAAEWIAAKEEAANPRSMEWIAASNIYMEAAKAAAVKAKAKKAAPKKASGKKPVAAKKAASERRVTPSASRPGAKK